MHRRVTVQRFQTLCVCLHPIYPRQQSRPFRVCEHIGGSHPGRSTQRFSTLLVTVFDLPSAMRSFFVVELVTSDLCTNDLVALD